jgi:hypothetical protein
VNDLFGSQIGAAGVAVYIIEWLKAQPRLKWITASTDRLNRLLSALLAALATVGIQTQFDPASGTLTITGLSLASILSLLWSWLVQFVLQELVYKGAVKKAS